MWHPLEMHFTSASFTTLAPDSRSSSLTSCIVPFLVDRRGYSQQILPNGQVVPLNSL